MLCGLKSTEPLSKLSCTWKNISSETQVLFPTSVGAGGLSQPWEQKMHTRLVNRVTKITQLEKAVAVVKCVLHLMSPSTFRTKQKFFEKIFQPNSQSKFGLQFFENQICSGEHDSPAMDDLSRSARPRQGLPQGNPNLHESG